jgi:inner membrane transporter RhtA
MLARLSQPPKSARAAAGLIILGAVMIQWSAAIVTPAFAIIGPAAVSGWRFVAGALVLLVVVRPNVRHWTIAQWRGAVIFGAASALMNLCFYQAIHRIHLGTAVAIEYLGPFIVAALGKRSWRHVFFVMVAAGGVVALARPGGGLTGVGLAFAAGSGVFWAGYAFASHKVGGSSSGFDGLAVAMTIAALITGPFAVHSLGTVLHQPILLGRLSLTGLMATVIGFGCELQALRRLSPVTVSVLLSLDPAVAFASGWLALGQRAHLLDLVGLVCVVAAGIEVTRDAPPRAPELPL